MLSAASAEYLIRFVESELLGIRHPPEAAKALRELRDHLTALDRPARFTLRPDPRRGGWIVGANDGIHAVPPSGRRGGESTVARMLSMIELAVSWPGDPVSVLPFMLPGDPPADVLATARIQMTRARAWIDANVDAGMATLLESAAVGTDDLGGVVLTYRPPPGAPPIVTSYVPPL